MKQGLLLIIALLISNVSLAQGLYSQSLAVTEIEGVWTNGSVVLEYPNVIASNRNAEYVSSNIYSYKNISMIQAEKYDYKDKTYFVWEIHYKMKEYNKEEGVDMIEFLALTESQNNQLKEVSSTDVSIVQIPTFGTMALVKSLMPDEIEEGIKKAILEKEDIMANTYTITARKEDDCILFNYEVDSWTHSGDFSKRVYDKLDLVDNLDGGYFKIANKEWEHLFFR